MANTDRKNSGFGLTKSKWSVVPIILSGLLAGGTLAGSAVGIWQISKNYTESPDFTKTVNGRIKINPFANYTKGDETFEEAKRITNECAKKLSRWLKDRGQAHYDVTAECYETDKDNVFDCYLNAQFEISKIANKDPRTEEDEKKKIDNDPYLSFFSNNAFNSNEKTFVYRWYIKNSEEESAEPQYSVIPFREIFDLPKTTEKPEHQARTLVDKDGQNGVVLQANSDKLSEIYKDLNQAKKDNEEPEPEPSNKIDNVWQQPRLYIVNNIQGLFNEANYHLSNWWSHDQGKDDEEYTPWYNGTDYATFANNYKTYTFKGNTDDDKRSTTDANKTFKLGEAKNHDSSVNLVNFDIFNYLDKATAGNAEIAFTNKYIDKIVTINDFDKFMPEKITDHYKNNFDDEENPDVDYFWYSTTSKHSAATYLNNQINYGFKEATIQGLEFDTGTSTGADGADKVFEQITTKDIMSQTIQPTFTETIFGGSNLVGVLSLGFLIFLIVLLVILACLYRTTGVISWICMMFALSMTGLIATIGSTAIGMSLIFGLFTMSIVGFLTSLAICGRLKRRLKSREDTQVMIKKAFKTSLLPVVDVSIITLIFGICFTYIAPIALNAFGLVLVSGAFMTFISVYLINGLLHALFFNNRIMINKYQFFGKPSNIANEALAQSNNAVPASLDATKLDIPYYSSISRKKIDATNKKALIAICVVGGLLLAGIIVFSVLGFTSPTLFHTTTCVAIQYDGNIFKDLDLHGLSYVSYKHSGDWWFFYTNMSNASSIAQQIATDAGLEYGISVQCQSIFGSTNKDILNLALISIIVATLVSALYAGIRHNWIAIVPMIAGAFGIPLLIIGMSAICQVKFDQFVVIAFALVAIANTIFAMNIAGSINESWSRKEAFTNEEFRYILNVSLTNNWTYIWNTLLVYGLFILIYGLSAPVGPSTNSTIGLLIIGCIVTVVITPFVVSFILYQFMKVRNFALSKRAEKSKNKVVVNYDDIDEQGIEGINKFTKKIPVSQPKQGE